MTKAKRAAAYRRPLGLADYLLMLALVLVALVVGAVGILPRALGYTVCAVASESMSPALRRGDLVVIKPATLDELTPGTIVAAELDGALVTHRVVETDPAAGTLRTRADAAPMLDAYAVQAGQIVGRVLYKIPILGYIPIWRSNT